MAKPGKGKKLISVTAPNEMVALIDVRAEALGWSRAQFALAVLQQWVDEGAKPISEPDRLMIIASQTGKSVTRKAS